MPYAPSWILKGLSQIELDALRVAALARITGGDRTALSGANKSSSKQWAMLPQDLLKEIVYAEEMLSGVPRKTRVHADLRSRPIGWRVC